MILTAIVLTALAVLLFLPRTARADELEYDPEYPVGSVIGDAIGISPELAPRGRYAIGVRTIEVTQKNRIDVSSLAPDTERRTYDRPLTLEVWYPCKVQEGQRQLSFYTDHLGTWSENNLVPFDFPGRAVRDAEAYAEDGAYPAVIISHGYPGSRYLLSNLAENLATKGYVVVSIGHTDNIYTDFAKPHAFVSAMIDRTLDQRFAIDCLDTLNADGWLKGLIDTDRVGMMGYSFGGFGLLRTLGATLKSDLVNQFGEFTGIIDDKLLARFRSCEDLLREADGYRGDKRVKAAVLFAPFGEVMFDPDSLENIDVPTLWIQGRVDVTVPYEGVRRMFERANKSDRHMLIYELLSHKAATNPAPLMSQAHPYLTGARRWEDCVWDQRYVNGINFHFVTALMDACLKGETEKLRYLDVKESVGMNAVYATEVDGTPKPEHTYWPGFVKETAVGLVMETRKAE